MEIGHSLLPTGNEMSQSCSKWSPWEADVWWLLNDRTGQTKVAFPQMATGEEAVLERLRLLPGFEVRGMNSMESALFRCWPTPA